jgi:hypothetical protein
MAYAQPGTTENAFLDGAPSGLVGTLTFKVITATGASSITETTSGITEIVPGVYRKQFTVPVSGEYLIVWHDGTTAITEELVVTETGHPPPRNTSLVPTLGDVATLVRARTVDENGNRGAFTSSTNPTDDQVDELIGRAVDEVRRRGGPTLASTDDESLIAAARELAAIRAAMLVELSYYPEQANEDSSAYARLKEMWDEQMGALLSSLTTDPGDVQGIGSIRVASPTAAAYTDQRDGFDPYAVA